MKTKHSTNEVLSAENETSHGDYARLPAAAAPKKLIRSKIPMKLKPGEWDCEFNIDELNRLFILKVKEELYEIKDSNFKDIKEFADLLNVVESFAATNGFYASELAKAALDKSREKGDFGIIVLTNLNPTNPSNRLYFEEQHETTNLVDYMHEFAFEFGKLWNTELTHEEKMKRINEKIKMPEEVVLDFFSRFLGGCR